MTSDEIRRLRLQNQQISHTLCGTPEEVVAHLGAMQAQEYHMALWAVGLRLPDAAARDVEAAFSEGRVLRTHLLRPTWHFVTPGDIRWMLSLCAPQVHAKNAPYYRKNGLDGKALAACCRVIEQALGQAGCLTRGQLAQRLDENGIAASGQRLSYIMMYAELEGLVCSGPRAGKQFTYRLLDTAAPPCSGFGRDEGIARLAQRYFTSRGPASARDFACWSGLAPRDAKRGAQMLGAEFSSDPSGVEPLYFQAEETRGQKNGNEAFLLPDYDEYGMGYKDRTALMPEHPPPEEASEYSHWLVLRGRIEGTWAVGKSGAAAAPYAALDAESSAAVRRAVERYDRFVQMLGKGNETHDE